MGLVKMANPAFSWACGHAYISVVRHDIEIPYSTNIDEIPPLFFARNLNKYQITS